MKQEATGVDEDLEGVDITCEEKISKAILSEQPDEWLNDAKLGNALHLLKEEHPNANCKIMFPMPQSRLL